MKTTTLDTAASPSADLPSSGIARLRRVCEWLVSAAVAGFGVLLMLE